MAPNLGWRDVAAAGGARRVAFGDDVPISVANEADLGALVEFRRGAAVGADDVLFLSGEVGVGGGIIVDGRPAHRRGRLRRRGRPHAGQPRRARRAGAAPSAAGRPRSASPAPAAAWPAARPAAAGREVDALLRDAEAGVPGAPCSALDHVGRWLGIGLAGLVNILDPRLVVLGGLFGRIHPFVGVDRSSASSIDGRWPLRAGSSASSRPSSAWRRRCSAPPSSPLEPLLADPAGWLVPRRVRPELATA